MGILWGGKGGSKCAYVSSQTNLHKGRPLKLSSAGWIVMIFAPEFIFLSEWLYIPFPPPFYDSIMLSQEPFLLFAGDLPECGGHTSPLSLQVKAETCSVEHNGSWQMKLCVHRK